MWLHIPIRYLDRLPDSGRLGANLMAVGAVVCGIRFAWPHYAPESFQKANVFFLRIAPYLPFGSWYRRDLGVFLLFSAALCFAVGAFVFFRKAVWRSQEKRYEQSQIELRLR